MLNELPVPVLPGRRLRAAAPVALLCLACDTDAPVPVNPNPRTWITEPEYRFTSGSETGVLFSHVYLRADPNRDRVFVIDRIDRQVSAWTPDGSLIFVVGRPGDGPGEFMLPTRLHFQDDGGFYVREGYGSRFTYYSTDGVPTRTEPGPGATASYQGLSVSVEATAVAEAYFVVPQTGLASATDSLVERYPVMRARRSGSGHWLPPEPVFWMNNRNRWHAVPVKSRTAFFGQLFGDYDLSGFRPGVAVVARRTQGPGVVELTEMNPDGDTIWHRHLQFEPIRLTPERTRTEAEKLQLQSTAFPGVSGLELRKAWEETLYRPAHLPGAINLALTASGEVWLSTFEELDTLRVFYALRRDDVARAPKRVLVPKWLSVQDVTDTHVWGILEDDLGLPHVVGRRLVPIGESVIEVPIR